MIEGEFMADSFKQFNVRLEETLLNDLKEIAEKETAKTKYNIDTTNIVRRALTEFVERYKQEDKAS